MLLNQSSFMHVFAHLFSCLVMKQEILFYMMSNHVNEIFTLGSNYVTIEGQSSSQSAPGHSSHP